MTSKSIGQELGNGQTNAGRAMSALIEAGVVKSRDHYGTKMRYYWCPDVLDALDRFAGRRRL